MLGWDDMPKEPPSFLAKKSMEHKAPGSPGALGGTAHSETVIFADGKKQGWWQASDKGILNEAEAADDKAANKGFTPQFGVAGVSQSYGSIFGKVASTSEQAATTVTGAVADATQVASEAVKTATDAVVHAAAGATEVASSAVAAVTTKVGEMDPFAELVSPGAKPAEHPALEAFKAEAAAIPGSRSSGGGAPPEGAVGSPAKEGGITFADGKKSGWWAAGDSGILNEADAEDVAKGTAKKFDTQFSVTGQKNNYGSMLNWKKDEPAAAAKEGAKEGAKDEDWDPFQSAAKP